MTLDNIIDLVTVIFACVVMALGLYYMKGIQKEDQQYIREVARQECQKVINNQYDR